MQSFSLENYPYFLNTLTSDLLFNLISLPSKGANEFVKVSSQANWPAKGKLHVMSITNQNY
jgi:hypothetical protein